MPHTFAPPAPSHLIPLVTLALLAGNPLEVIHLRGGNGRSNEGQMIDNRRLVARLIVLHEHLNVLHVLELDEAQQQRRSRFQILLVHHQILHRNVRFGHIEIDRPRLVDEQPDILGPMRWRCLELDRMDFDHLVEGDRNDQLLVAVRCQVSGLRTESIHHRMVVRFVQTFALVLLDEGG